MLHVERGKHFMAEEALYGVYGKLMINKMQKANKRLLERLLWRNFWKLKLNRIKAKREVQAQNVYQKGEFRKLEKNEEGEAGAKKATKKQKKQK